MRDISEELLAKIQKRSQTVYENANPALRLYFSKGLNGELFRVYTIQSAPSIEPVDVTVKRTNTYTEPAEVFAITLQEGIATVWSKLLPYDDQIPWVFEFTLGTDITDVAIEFDGYWERDWLSGRFNLVTEESPWIYYVAGGNLYAQKWQDAPLLLDSGVVKCAALRGWVPANGIIENDQGLLVGYLKTDGKVYYRGYCALMGGGKGWDVAREVSYFGSDVVDFALFRTNDFRVGFVAESNGQILWAISKRNWAGMSVASETFSFNIVQSTMSMTLYEITSHAYSTPIETFALNTFGGMTVNLYEETPEDIPFGVSDARVVDSTHIAVTFDKPVFLWRPALLVNSMTLSVSSVVTATFDAETNTVLYELGVALEEQKEHLGVDIRLTSGVFILEQSATRRAFLPSTQVFAVGTMQQTIETFVAETFSMTLVATAPVFVLYEVTVHSYPAYPNETFAMTIVAGTMTMLLTDTTVDPV